nr:uncharacterized protein LOC111510260 [Leptinotarsa decemlineata]
MAIDFRREWVKKKFTKFFGLNSNKYFEEMIENSDDLDDKLSSYLEDDYLTPEENKVFFYVYKTSHEKLVEEEIMVAEKVKKAPPIEEPKVEEISSGPKKKGKDKKGGHKKHQKKTEEAVSPTSDGNIT